MSCLCLIICLGYLTLWVWFVIKLKANFLLLFQKSFALPEDSSNDNHTTGGSTMLDAYISKMDIDNINRDCIMTAAPPHPTSTNLSDRPGGSISIGTWNQTVNVSRTSSTAIPFPSNYKKSPNCTPTNISPVVTPKTTSPDHQLSQLSQYVGQRLMEEKRTNTYGGMPFSRPGAAGTLHNFFNGCVNTGKGCKNVSNKGQLLY